MPREITQAGKIGDLRRFLAALEANAADLAHLEGSRLKLEGLFSQVVQINREQAVRRAAKQEATKQLQVLLVEAERLSTVLRLGVKEHYGIRSEKLAEFELQPFRGLTRKPKPAPENPEAPNPTPPPSSPEEPSGPVS